MDYFAQKRCCIIEPHYSLSLFKLINMKKVAILGCGNLGSSIIEGLIASDFCKPTDIIATRRNPENIKRYADLGVTVISDNKKAANESDTIILAVKPFQAIEVLNQIKDELTGKILISVVTGVLLKDISNVVNENCSIFRAMPNTAIAIQQSMTCISALSSNAEQLAYVKNLFSVLGKVAIIDEKLMDAATVLGACGIAYAMRYIRANIQGGIEIGFDAQTAGLIAAQTVKGASELLLQKGLHPEQEIDKVTTPKGCTIAGLNEMEHQGFSSSLIKGICASYAKIA